MNHINRKKHKKIAVNRKSGGTWRMDHENHGRTLFTEVCPRKILNREEREESKFISLSVNELQLLRVPLRPLRFATKTR